MRPKEAQVLGILALIAGGIIVLCLWGGKGGSHDRTASTEPDSAATSAGAGARSPTSIEELVDRVQAQDRERQIQDARRAAEGGAGRMNVPIRRTSLPDPGRSPQTPVQNPVDPGEAPAPGTGPIPTGSAHPLPARVHIVKHGDSLYKISKQYYNTGAHWKKIQEANKALVPDPEKLKLDTRLVIPPLDQQSAIAGGDDHALLSAGGQLPDGGKYYVVQQGDNLWSIAEDKYGDGTKWKIIADANPQADPNALQLGMQLVLP